MWKKKNWTYLALTLTAQSLLQATPAAFADAQTPVRVEVRSEAARIEREQARAWANRQRRPVAPASTPAVTPARSTLLLPAANTLVASRVVIHADQKNQTDSLPQAPAVITKPKMVDQDTQAESAAPAAPAVEVRKAIMVNQETQAEFVAPVAPAAVVRKAILVDNETQADAPAAPAAVVRKAVMVDSETQGEVVAPAAPVAIVLPEFTQPEKKSIGHCRPKSQSDASIQASDLMKNLDEIAKKDQASEKDDLNAIKKRITDEASDEELDLAFNALKDFAESDSQACRKNKGSIIEGFRRLAKHYAMQDEKRRGRPEVGDDEGYDSYGDSESESFGDEAGASFYRGDSSADGGYAKAKGIIADALSVRCLKENRRLEDVLENLNDNHMVYLFKRNGTQSMEVNANFYSLYNYRVSRLNDACTGWNVGMECQIAARALQNTQTLPYYAQQAQMQRIQSQMAAQQMINNSMSGNLANPVGNNLNGNFAPSFPGAMAPTALTPTPAPMFSAQNNSAPNFSGGFYGSGRQTF